MGVAMQGLSKIFRAPIVKIIRYRAHRAVIFAIAWHLVIVAVTSAAAEANTGVYDSARGSL